MARSWANYEEHARLVRWKSEKRVGGGGEERRSKHAQTKGRGGVRRGDGWRSRAARKRERDGLNERERKREGGDGRTDGWTDGWTHR